jgi:hypothetical protein
MGLLEALTLTFIVLKLAGIITWNWILVLSPLFPAILVYTIIIILFKPWKWL